MADLPYVAVTITLAANTTTNLLDAIKATEPRCPSAATQVVIQNDPTDGPTTLAVGDASLGAARRGYKLLKGDPSNYSRTYNNVLLGHLFVRADEQGDINVEVMLS